MRSRGGMVGATNESRRALALVAALAGMAIWLLTRRYGGLVGDGRLYAFMALALNDPKTFGSDLFVKFGSQGAFSLFSPLYGFLIGRLGLGAASIGLLLAGQGVWLVGAWRLTHRLVRGLGGHASFVLVTAIGAVYGGWGVLYAGESLLTPRALAEGLTMIGLAMIMDRAWIRAGVALILASLFHPVMALAGLGAAFLIIAAEWPLTWWLAPLGAALVVALAVARVPPFATLATIMDGPWLAGVTDHDGFDFTGAWLPADWARVAANLAVCGAAALLSRGVRQRLFIAVCVTAIAGLAVTVVGADLAHDALVVQLQTWRLSWILAVVALPAIVLVALRLRRHSLGWPATALLAAPLVVMTRPFSDHLWAWCAGVAMSAAGLILTGLIQTGRQPKLSATASRIAVELALVMPFAAAVDSLINLVEDLQFRAAHGVFSLDPMAFIGVRLALLAAGMAGLWIARRRPRVALAACAIGIAGAALMWDARTPWERYIESGAPSPLALPPSATLLWGDEAAPTWLLMHRPVYVSATQSAGLVFSKATATEWERRAALVRPLVGLDAWSPSSKPPTCAELAAPISRAVVAATCHRSDGLTGVVLGQPVTGAATTTFATPLAEPVFCLTRGRVDNLAVRRFYYLACEDAGR